MIDKKKILRYAVISMILILIMVSFSQTMGLAGKGFNSDEVLKQFSFYIGPGIGFLIGIWFCFVIGKMINKDEEKYGHDSVAFADQGDAPSLIPKGMSSFQIFLLSLVFFLIIGIFAFNIKQTSFTGMKLLPQQFTAVGNVLFSSALIPISENLGAGFLLAVFLVTLRRYARKYNMTKANFIGLSYIIGIPLIGLIGVANHTLRYSGSDVALMTVFLFWSFGAFMTLLTGSIIPFIVMHAVNNAFIDLGRYFSNENVFIYFGIVVFITIILYFLLYRDNLFGGKKVKNEIV